MYGRKSDEAVVVRWVCRPSMGRARRAPCAAVRFSRRAFRRLGAAGADGNATWPSCDAGLHETL